MLQRLLLFQPLRFQLFQLFRVERLVGQQRLQFLLFSVIVHFRIGQLGVDRRFLRVALGDLLFQLLDFGFYRLLAGRQFLPLFGIESLLVALVDSGGRGHDAGGFAVAGGSAAGAVPAAVLAASLVLNSQSR